MTVKLCQMVALTAGQKGRTTSTLTEVYHKLQKTELVTGLARRYTPKEEDGEQFPNEYKRVQYTARLAIEDTIEALTKIFDIVITTDMGNTRAKADIVVEGRVLAEKVPVTTLLFLEKQLKDLETMISKIPVLDQAEDWTWDAGSGYYVSTPSRKIKTKKVPKVFIKYEATKEHPAQTEMVHEDVTIGHWDETKFSGAIPATEREAALKRVNILRDAVTLAREEANQIEVDQYEIGRSLLNYVFAGSATN